MRNAISAKIAIPPSVPATLIPATAPVLNPPLDDACVFSARGEVCVEVDVDVVVPLRVGVTVTPMLVTDEVLEALEVVLLVRVTVLDGVLTALVGVEVELSMVTEAEAVAR